MTGDFEPLTRRERYLYRGVGMAACLPLFVAAGVP